MITTNRAVPAALAACTAFAPAALAQPLCPPQDTLTSPAPFERERFGEAVAIRGDRVAMATREGGNVYVFRDTGAGWEADQPIRVLLRGDSLAFGDERLLIGSGSGNAAFIYRAPPPGGDEWTLETRIDGPGPFFAASVAMTTGGDGAQRAFLMAPFDGSGYVIVLRRDGGAWVEEDRISGYAVPFGQNLAADGDTVAVVGGAAWFGGGSVLIFEREGATWLLTGEVSEPPLDLAPYGAVLALRDDVLAVGAHRTSTDPLPGDPHGRVFVYRRHGALWELETVINEDGSRGDWYFAQDMSFAGEWLAIESSGSIQLYAPRGGEWEYIDALRTPLTHGLLTVAGDRDAPARLIAGEPYTDRSRGAAHIFSLAACYCRADLTGDGVLDSFDFLEFQSLFAAGDLRADFDDNGVLDFFDFLAFQEQFAAGCP